MPSSTATRSGGLSTLSAIADEHANLYRQAKRGQLDVKVAAKLTYILTAARCARESADIDKRIAALEAAQALLNAR